MQLTHTSLYSADLLQKDILDSFNCSSVYCYYIGSLQLVITILVRVTRNNIAILVLQKRLQIKKNSGVCCNVSVYWFYLASSF